MAERKEEISGNGSETCQVPGKQHWTAPGRSDYILCKPCLKKDTKTPAVVFCKTCNEFQCTCCSNVHKDFDFMENHEIVKANEAESTPRSCNMKGLDACDKHQKLLEFFCKDEKLLCCSSCAIVDHRKCHTVVEIKSIARKSSSAGSELQIKLQDIKAKAEMVVTQTHEAEEHLDQDIKEIPRKIKRMRDEVMKMFDDLEVSVSTKAAAFQTETVRKLAKKQTTSQKHVSDVTKTLETVENVNQFGTPTQQFIVEHKLKDQVNDLQVQVEETCKDLETVTISFDFDETVRLPPLPIADYIPGQLTLNCNTSETFVSIVHKDPIVKLEMIRSIDLKQTGDDVSKPLYTGVELLSDGRLVAVDNKNKKCLIFNEKLEKAGSYQLSFFPQSVVAISEEEVAITYCAGYKVDFLRVSKANSITLLRSCTVKTQYGSICMKGDGNLVVGTVDNIKPVGILSLSGEEQDIGIHLPDKKYPLNSSACTYIKNSNKLVLSDSDEQTVYIYDMASNTRVVVKDDCIKTPRGVAVGPSDCILVCSQNTHSIVQISQTGRILSSYKLDTKYPYRVCVSMNKSMLAVTTNQAGETAKTSDKRRIKRQMQILSSVVLHQRDYRLKESISRHLAEALRTHVTWLSLAHTIAILITGFGQSFILKRCFSEKSHDTPAIATEA